MQAVVADDDQFAAVAALAQMGPAALAARPALRRLVEGRDPVLARLAARAMRPE